LICFRSRHCHQFCIVYTAGSPRGQFRVSVFPGRELFSAHESHLFRTDNTAQCLCPLPQGRLFYTHSINIQKRCDAAKYHTFLLISAYQPPKYSILH